MQETEAAALRRLLKAQPVAALATLHRGAPAVSMVPFALLPSTAAFVVHVSRLATHTQDMLSDPAVALLVTGRLEDAPTPLALPRVSLQGRARPCGSDAPGHAQARTAYLARHPDARELFEFQDFSLFVIEPESVRFVAGFGRALSLTPSQLHAVLEAQG
ncbi:MAG: pyridoxamine 5'-phosphate oxidase family protein [Piscinibacter sp.]|nr:pyridoxamine 5'-phosphate oxidase family protein [Piscinibacter sp.]